MLKLSVLMPIYGGESPLYLAQCLESLKAQSLPADEILIVKDGPLGEHLEVVLREYETELPIRTLELARNQGLGAAARLGVEQCRNELIARMDSDDLCVPRRFEIQVAYIESHPETDIVGGFIREFDSDYRSGLASRKVPSEHRAICALAKRRNPMNHMTVLFRRTAVLAAGNYRTWFGFEDYDLWVRMIRNGARFHNLEDVLVLARCGNGMQTRRGGWDYLRREASLLWSFREGGFITTPAALWNIACRIPARLAPSSLRGKIYRKFLRSTAESLPLMLLPEIPPPPAK